MAFGHARSVSSSWWGLDGSLKAICSQHVTFADDETIDPRNVM